MNLKQTMLLVGVLVKKLGGSVEVTRLDMESATGRLERVDDGVDKVTYRLVEEEKT
jgi:hypothetical protein